MRIRPWILLFLLQSVACLHSQGQATAFTYQDRLSNNGMAANGSYDFIFSVFPTNVSGAAIAAPVTNAAVAVNNGLFTTTMDFGAIFDGSSKWLEISVATNGGGNFTTLSPRELITAAPYATIAEAVMPGGIPAATYTNAVAFNNPSNLLTGNGAGLINISFSGLSVGAQTQITNAARGAMVVLQSNLNALATSAVTNLYGYDGVVVLPYANVPSSIMNSSRFFGPWLGADYVQKAINSLPSGDTNGVVGGGKIMVVGNNYVPSTLLFTNPGNGVMSWDIEAPAFEGGALVCQTDPCMLFQLGYESDSIPLYSVTMKNLVVSSTLNETNYLFYEKSTAANNHIEACYFVPWEYATNNVLFDAHMGLSTPSTISQAITNNLVVYFNSFNGDVNTYIGNHFHYLAAVYEGDDHFAWIKNMFMGVGRNSLLNGECSSTTLWPTNSMWWSGAAVVVGGATGAFPGDGTFLDSHFYSCGGAYFINQDVEGPGPLAQFETINDHYETTPWSVLHFGPGGKGGWSGNVFEQIDPTGITPKSATAPDSADFIDVPIGEFVGDRSSAGVVYTSLPAAAIATNMVPGAAITNVTLVGCNGGGLTNVSAAAITGGFSTNLNFGNHTLYITNGVIMNVQ